MLKRNQVELRSAKYDARQYVASYMTTSLTGQPSRLGRRSWFSMKASCQQRRLTR